jgi:hypothetical protein
VNLTPGARDSGGEEGCERVGGVGFRAVVYFRGGVECVPGGP